MPGFSALASLGSVASTRSVRATGSTRLSTALTVPAKVWPAIAAVEAETAWPTATSPDARSGTSKATVTFDMSSSVAIALDELMRSPTAMSVRPMMPAKGAVMVRLARSFAAAFRPMAAFCSAVRASVSATVVILLVLASCPARSSADWAVSRAILAFSSATCWSESSRRTSIWPLATAVPGVKPSPTTMPLSWG